MNQKYYSTKEKLFLGILFFAALLSLFFFINFRTLAFPEHTIKFAITREQAAEKAKKFVSELAYKPTDFKETTIFSIDNQSKTYLEREVGVTETAKLAADEIDVWNFTTRFFKPLQKEEITVAILPNGRLAGYYRAVDEAAPGAHLSKTRAQERAETFLANTIKADLSQWTLVSGESTQRPKRTDHTFVWEKKGFKAKDATYRTEVQIYGDQLGSYTEYLKVPETWLRAYEKETSNNDLAQTIAEAVMFLLFGIAIIITFIREYRHNNLRLTAARNIGLATAIIAMFTALNSIPLSLSGYPTTVSWEAFIGSVVLLGILGGFFEGGSVMFVIAAGEAKFRKMFPDKLSLESLFTSALPTKSVNKALFVGVFAGIIFFTYELVYYFLGKSLGFWAPADINYADIYSTVLPWVYPLFIGFTAAATEEGIFRLFGISFLKKFLKSNWAAILVTAIVWGFLHSNYPQSPWFVRGIEISLIGIVLGWIYVRFGFIASFTAHFTFNALQTAISFYQAGSLYASISSTIVSLLPFILAVILLGIAILKKGFLPERKEDLNANLKMQNQSEKQEKSVIHEATYNPLSKNRKIILVGLSLISLVSLWILYPKTSLNQLPTSVGRKEVMEAAEKALSQRTIKIDEYKHVVTFTPKDITLEEKYILQEKDFQTLKSLYPEKLPLAYWTVRYFKPLQKEEYIVDVLPNGKIYQVVHTLDEKAPGANLTQAQAKKLADSYLQSEKGFNLSGQKVVENKTEKKEKRTDYFFVYEERDNAVGQAMVRTDVLVKGDEVSGFDRYLKLPESWLREQEETTTLDFVVGGMIGLVAVMIVGFGFKTFLDLVREKKIDFRFALKLAAVSLLLSFIATLNSLSTFYSNYNTAIPLSTYIIQSVLSIILGFVFSFLIFAILLGLFITLWKQYLGQIFPIKTKERIKYIQDALISGYSIPLIMTALSSILVYFLITYDLLDSVAKFDTIPNLDTYFPSVSVISEMPLAEGGICLMIIAILLLKKYFKSWKRILSLALIVTLLLALPQQRTQDDLVISVLQNIIILIGGIVIITLVLKRNLLAYFFMLYSSLLLSSGWVLFQQQNMFFKVNGILLLFFALLPFLIYVWFLKRLAKQT